MSEHTIAELSALTGLPVRTIRYYISQGLIPSADKEGPSTRYPEATLARLRLITRLRDAHLPLAEIRKRLEMLDDDAVLGLMAAPEEPGPAGSALDYVRSLLGDTDQRSALEAPASAPASAPAGPPAAASSLSLLRRLESTPHPDIALRRPSLLRLEADIPPPASAPAPPADRPSIPQRSQWDRIAIAPDIELHVRRPLSRRDNRIVERLIAFARQLHEDKP